MKILAIETSCDDTCIAIAEISEKESRKNPKKAGLFNISFFPLSNIVSSQVNVHKKWGGVYPALAKREHQKNLTMVLLRALKESRLIKKRKPAKGYVPAFKIKKLKEVLIREKLLFKRLEKFLRKYEKPEIDLIAVTIGPGLEPCLWAGVNFAKVLAYFWNLPVAPINHLEAHIFANWFPQTEMTLQLSALKPKEIFPAICLVVSGGHTQLILMRGIGTYKIIGETLDDAAGECFDKTAKILGLPYPGGPAIAAEAAKLKTTNYKLKTKLPRPMIHAKNLDFSFSGLKTAVLYQIKPNFQSQKGLSKKIRKSSLGWKSKSFIRLMCYEIQQAIIDVLIKKTMDAAKTFKAKSIILGGGVSANSELRKQLKEKIDKELPSTKYLVPEARYSTDNALMVAACAHYGKKPINDNWKKLEAKANLRL